MKNKFLFKLVGITSAVAVTIGGIGVYNYVSEAALNTDNISVVTNNSIKEETKSTAKIPSGKPEKEETVYIFTNAKGERQNIIVSNHLKNTDNADNLQDMTSLSNIENVKGDEAFKQNGESVDWKSNGSDIYYQGNTDKKPPISVKVSYKLDGNDIEPDELLGKNGKVTIRYDYENNAGETKKINGKDEEVFVPFTMATVLTLPCDKFSNINVINGKVMSEGNNSVVLAITFPKLAKSLGLDDKEEKLPEYFEITADVKDFALNMSITAALPDMISELIDTDSNAKNKLQDNIDKLLDGVDELKTGTATLKSKSGKLADGIKTLDSGSDKLSKNISKLSTGASTLKTGIYSFKNGADKLSVGANKLNAGIDSVKDGADKLSEGGTKLSSSLTALSEEYSKINAGIISLVDKVSGISTSASKQVNELNNGISTYKEKMGALIKAYGSEEKIAANPADWAAYNQMKGAVGAMESMATSLSAQSSPDENSAKNLAVLKDGSAKIDAALKTLAASSDTFSESLNKLSAGASSLSSGNQELKSGLNNLSAGAAKLYTGAASLEKGAEKLDAGAKDLHKGSSKLNSSVVKLIEGIANLDSGAEQLNEGVETFSSKLSATDLTNILNHLDVVTKLGKDYTTFSGADENEKNSVKFIIKVDGIEGNDK